MRLDFCPRSWHNLPMTSKSRKSNGITKALIAAIVVTAAICAGYVLTHPFTGAKLASRTTAGQTSAPAPSPWHEDVIAGQGFEVNLPCQNTIATPQQNAYGLLESIGGASDVGYTSVECNTTLTDAGPSSASGLVSCGIQAFDGLIPNPTRISSAEAWLRTISNDNQDPVINVHGATVIEHTDAATQELFAVANGRYYQLEADCTAAAVGVGKTYLLSFTPLNN